MHVSILFPTLSTYQAIAIGGLGACGPYTLVKFSRDKDLLWPNELLHLAMGSGATKPQSGWRDSLAAWAQWKDRSFEMRTPDTLDDPERTIFPDPGPTMRLPADPEPVDNGDLLFVGLDGAGKTAIVSILALRHMPGDLVVGPAPSARPDRILCRTRSHVFYAVDMPGRRLYRTDWFSEETLSAAQPRCIIFVVDATDSFRFPLVKQQFLNLTRIEKLDGVSILILANKQDLKGAYSADALRTELGISKLLRNQKRMLKVLECTVSDPEGVFEAASWAVTSGNATPTGARAMSPTKDERPSSR